MKGQAGIEIRRVAKEDGEWKTRFRAFYADCGIKPVEGLEHAYFAAYSDDEIAGHSVIYFEGGRWVLDGLRVKPEFRERGIAKGLTEARIRYALERGAKEVWYSCEDGNLVTICCHVRYGFQKVCPDSHRCNAAIRRSRGESLGGAAGSGSIMSRTSASRSRASTIRRPDAAASAS